MFETLDKVLLAGLGALAMTRERAEKIFDEYAQRGEAERGTRGGFVKDLMDNAEKARKELEKVIGEQMKGTIGTLELATKEDLHRLEKKIDKLLKLEQ